VGKTSLKSIGVGFDNEDGHKRITRSEDFVVVGGSKDTHDMLVEVNTKTSEIINKKGQITQEEFRRIAESVS
jgi:uncharacterized protein YjlB